MNLPPTAAVLEGNALAIEETLKAPIARVYDAWTLPTEMRVWIGPTEDALIDLQADLYVGGRILLEYASDKHLRNTVEGRYLEIVAQQSLVFSWCCVVERWDGTVKRSPESRVSVTFTAVGDYIKVCLVHEAISDAGREAVGQGWALTLTRMAKYLYEHTA